MAVDIQYRYDYMASPLLRGRFACKIMPKAAEPLRPCIQLSSHSEASGVVPPPVREKKAKKRVSFADNRGLALTMVKVYSEREDFPFNFTELLENVVTLTTAQCDNFVLDFDQPSNDYLRFQQRLQAGHVCLENCTLQDKALSGTVKVQNLAFEKSVKIRMTFDTWKSFKDFECRYMNDTYTGKDKDTFAFTINLPSKIQSYERIEFAVCYHCSGQTYWDSNEGKNYRIVRAELRGMQGGLPHKTASDLGISFDPFGSSDRFGSSDHFGSSWCSYGQYAEWPSYLGYEMVGPYY